MVKTKEETVHSMASSVRSLLLKSGLREGVHRTEDLTVTITRVQEEKTFLEFHFEPTSVVEGVQVKLIEQDFGHFRKGTITGGVLRIREPSQGFHRVDVDLVVGPSRPKQKRRSIMDQQLEVIDDRPRTNMTFGQYRKVYDMRAEAHRLLDLYLDEHAKPYVVFMVHMEVESTKGEKHEGWVMTTVYRDQRIPEEES